FLAARTTPVTAPLACAVPFAFVTLAGIKLFSRAMSYEFSSDEVKVTDTKSNPTCLEIEINNKKMNIEIKQTNSWFMGDQTKVSIGSKVIYNGPTSELRDSSS
ncbi:MAG: hypothetical protein V4489_01700, partial [Chlamydiota bacterium]